MSAAARNLPNCRLARGESSSFYFLPRLPRLQKINSARDIPKSLEENQIPECEQGDAAVTCRSFSLWYKLLKLQILFIRFELVTIPIGISNFLFFTLFFSFAKLSSFILYFRNKITKTVSQKR